MAQNYIIKRFDCSKSRGRIEFLFAIFLLISVNCSFAEKKSWELDSETIFQTFERQIEPDKENRVFPVYEYLSADYGSDLSEGVSVHVHGWGRHDLADNGFYTDDPNGELLYGYLAYKLSRSGPVLNVGRQGIFTGITDECIDGLRVESPFLSGFILSAYAGVPAANGRDKERDGHRIYGGRVDYKINAAYDIGVYHQTVMETSGADDQKIGLDFAAILPGDVLFSGNSNYNLASNGWSGHDYGLNVSIHDFNIHPFFHRYQYRDLFDSTARKSSPFRYLAQTGETLTEAGGDLIWRKMDSPYELGCTLKHYTYAIKTDTNDYYSGFVNLIPQNPLIGFELGYMNGENSQNRFLLERSYITTRTIPYISETGSLSVDVMNVDYDEPVFKTGRSLFISLSCRQAFYDDALNVILSFEYSESPYFTSDSGVYLIVNYRLGNRAEEEEEEEE